MGKIIALNKQFSRAALRDIAAETTLDYVRRHPELTEDIGKPVSDGAIYAGISPDTGKRMFAAPDSEALQMRWDAARIFAREKQGGWRLPTVEELRVLFNNRDKGALKDTFFAEKGDYGWYWSSVDRSTSAWGRNFRTGMNQPFPKDVPAYVRLVRS